MLSLTLEGDKLIIPVVRDKENGSICGMGCCIIRKAFINGQVKKVGYLSAMKISSKYKGLLYMMKDMYGFIYENTKDLVDIYYTTILEDNKKAQKLLEKKRKNMPIYHYEGDYRVYLFAKGAFKLRRQSTSLKGYKFDASSKAEIEEFYKEHLKKYNFSPIDTKLHGLKAKDFFTLKDETGNIVAACGLWDQRDYKQYIVTSYGGIYKYLSRLPTSLLGYPSFPKENSPANYASISLFFVKDNDKEIGAYFLKEVLKASEKYDFLMVGLFENHPFNSMIDKIRHIKYDSRLYMVSWQGKAIELDEKPLNVEVGLL